ncbi:hypothetical protein V1264_014848 [Littorina saxatilis]|uniref:Uncharacterized protein n=1 Tax=Littorina saxatilis TaxID=31220 RepID=A0AAN9BS53_9CAEN
MELGNFEFSESQDMSVINRRELSGNGSSEQANIYDPAQDILDAGNRELEELRMKILKSSVRCHMLEVDLATQFNPQNQQLFADAQESCQQCTQTIQDMHQHVPKGIASLQAPVSPANVAAEHKVPKEGEVTAKNWDKTGPDAVRSEFQPEIGPGARPRDASLH